ncbi:MAG: hypothetical protein IJA23_04740 [Clostridia bacterium]|nr:hypothetical protein [Clostridia bacterium]
MELTKEQIKTLENVFNWALNLLEEKLKESVLFRQNEKGEFEKVELKDEEKKIVDLFETMKKEIKIKKDGGKENE